MKKTFALAALVLLASATAAFAAAPDQVKAACDACVCALCGCC